MNFSIQALHTDSGFSWQHAMNMALASKLAYLEAGDVKTEAAKWGFEGAEFFRENRTEGFVASDAKCVLVSFRGTKELGDWLANLNALRAPATCGGEVHSGFLSAFRDAKATLQELMRDSGADGKFVWLTGHSLGGALCSMVAAELLNVPKIHGCYTFGQPRVANRTAQAHLREPLAGRYFRFINDDDVVPKVPTLLQHVGENLWFDSKGDLKDAPPGVSRGDFGPEAFSDEEFELFQERVRSLRPQINREHEAVEEAAVTESSDFSEAEAPATRGLFPSVRDHFMDRYLQKIWAKLQAQD